MAGFRKTNRGPREAALALGFRSGLEASIAAELERIPNLTWGFEKEKIVYQVPARAAKYTPDFILTTLGTGKRLVIESKGRFVTADRQKHLLLKEQHPGMDLRFVFSNAKARLSTVSKTTYGMWCEKHGFRFASKIIPLEWINE